MIAVVATLRVQDGKNAEFEKVFSTLSATVRSSEPGCVVYQLAKSRKEANTYKVLEIYKDQAALDHHAGTDHFKSGFGEMRALLDGRADIEVLDAV